MVFIIVTFFSLYNNNSVSENLPICTTIQSPYIPNPNGTLNNITNSKNCIPVNCSSLTASEANTIDDKKDGANCYYMGLPPCKTFIGDKKERENCADIIDLPLCSIFPVNDAISGVNCVRESKEINDPDSTANPRNKRGINYGIHNEDSIRFSGQAESCAVTEVCDNNSINDPNNSVSIKCHQLNASQTPNSGNNCKIIPCNLLTIEELAVSDNRFVNDSKKYCDGSAKCYDFFNNANIDEISSNNNNSDNLKYIIYRPSNTMCKIHDCPVSSPSCGSDDIHNITNKGEAYKEDYIQYINAGMFLDIGLCNVRSCRIIVERQYRCLPMGDDSPNTLNDNCDSNKCSNGYCTKTIDCNKPENNNEPECISSYPEGKDTDVDIFDAWFYRPTPPNRVVDNEGLIKGQNNNTSIYKAIKNDFCYNFQELDDMNWLTVHDVGFLGTYYYHYLWDDTRSPEMCNVSKLGGRGNGYGYLCDVKLLFNNRNPRDDVGYIKGVVGASYQSNNAAKYKIKACLRYVNSGQWDVCGKRECRINTSKGPLNNPWSTQWCGYDVCREMTIDQSMNDECSITANNELFDSSDNTELGCVSDTIDGYVRMRSQRYGRKICVFVDHKGGVAYDAKNFNGEEVLSDGSCVEGEKDSSNKCNGFNTNSEKGASWKWRTTKMIKYIGNNQPSNKKPGYIDMDGQFFSEQDCILVPIRIGPPKFYNIATLSNSENLFEPPLFILNVRTKRGGAISSPKNNERFGETDFFEPEITVQYGATKQLMSLGKGYIGDNTNKENYISSPWETEIITTVNNIERKANIFIKKEYDEISSQPLLCLYRRIFDTSGLEINSINISCINRTKPPINKSRNLVDTNIYSGFDLMATLITPDTNNNFHKAKLKLKLINSYGKNNKNNKCSDDDICSEEIIFENTNTINESCFLDVEKYKFCSRRDECSKLLYECIDNEVSLNNASNLGQATQQFEAFKTQCNTTILSECNKKFGITSSNTTDFFSQINKNLLTNIDLNYQNFHSIFNDEIQAKMSSNVYGWFNEICITKGFEDKLKKIIAYKTDNGVLGKCLIDTVKSIYLNDNDSTTNCNAGGKAPYCFCLQTTEGITLPSDQIVRNETPREAGLCIDIPLPKFCSPIDYTLDNNFDDYTSQSIINSITNNIFTDKYGSSNLSSYNNTNAIHTSHQIRKDNQNSNHAEYTSALEGVNNVAGVCKGFWKPQLNDDGIELKPILNCLEGGQWQKPNISNKCVRHYCPKIITYDAKEDGSYHHNYDLNEEGEDKGLKHGFAIWDKHNINNDFLENSTATSCITGFKPSNSTFDNITQKFVGGSMPTRYCNQIGKWAVGTKDNNPIKNPCVRITCPELSITNGSLPAKRNTLSEISDWNKVGGATFQQTNASRSSTSTRPESIATGECEGSLGFFTPQGAASPTKECNHLGQWQEVTNPCFKIKCYAIDGNLAQQQNNGYALWEEINYIPINGEINVKSLSCATGYVPNPYSPIDPITKQPSLPNRKCKSVATNNGWTAIWESPTTNSCINQCPGATQDSTIGIGITQHSTASKNELENIKWPATDFNKYAYINNCQNMNASSFSPNRSNGCYQLRRLCGSAGKWGDPEVMCVANSGQIGNAQYSDSDNNTTGDKDSLVVNQEISTGICVNGYWKSGNNLGLAPQRQCVYKDQYEKIDEVYLKLIQGNDCEEMKCFSNNILSSYNSWYSKEHKYIKVGDKIALTCKGDTYSRGYNGETCPVSGGISPIATCQADGQWQIKNDCTKCNGCPTVSYEESYNQIKGGTYAKDDWCFGKSHDFRNQIRQLDMKHGENSGTVLREQKSCLTQDKYFFTTAYCVNGTKIINNIDFR